MMEQSCLMHWNRAALKLQQKVDLTFQSDSRGINTALFATASKERGQNLPEGGPLQVCQATGGWPSRYAAQNWRSATRAGAASAGRGKGSARVRSARSVETWALHMNLHGVLLHSCASAKGQTCAGDEPGLWGKRRRALWVPGQAADCHGEAAAQSAPLRSPVQHNSHICSCSSSHVMHKGTMLS